jgi:hypothetical protein
LAVNNLNETFSNNTENLKPLLHELQLGEQLNACVHQSRRSDFSLMLAMLCDDVREQSQFVLPKSTPIDGTSVDVEKVNNVQLRKHFDLPKEAPLSLNDAYQISQFNQGQLVAEKKLASLHLTNAISPKPLAFRNDKNHISCNILANTSLVCQEKHELNQENDVLNKPLDMQVENWLKSIQTSLVKSNLIEVIAA